MGMRESDKLAIAESRRRRADPGTSSPRTARELGAVDRRRHDAAASVPGEPRAAAACLVFDDRGPRASRATTRSTCSTSTSRAATRATGNPSTVQPGARARVRRHAGRAGSAWRSATTCASRSCFGGCSAMGARVVLPAVGVHRADRARALGDAAARAGDREPLPRGGAGAVRAPRERPRDLRRLPDRGLLGPRARAPAARHRRRDRGPRPRAAARGQAEFPVRRPPATGRPRAT